jgi:hypothetical protein
MPGWDDEDKVQSEKDKRDERLGEALHHEYQEVSKAPQQAPEHASSPQLDYPGAGTVEDQPKGDPSYGMMRSPPEGYTNVQPPPTSEPVEPKLSDAVMPAAMANARALQTAPKGPSAVSRASGGVGPSPAPGAAPGGLVGPSPDPTLGLSQAPQTTPAPEAPKAPSAVEQLLASREQDRDELRRAQYDAETRRMSASGLNAVRAGLAMMAGHSPDAEAERSSMEAADAPVRDVLQRQKSDQDFQQQLVQAQAMDQKKDADDPTSPLSARRTLYMKSIGQLDKAAPAMSFNELDDVAKGADWQEKVAARKRQDAAETAKAEREKAQSAEDVRWHDMQYRIKQAELAKAKAVKPIPMSGPGLIQLQDSIGGIEANENIHQAALRAGNPAGAINYSRVISANLPNYAAGVNSDARKNIALQEGERKRFLWAGAGTEAKDQFHDTHHEQESKKIEDTLDINSQDPRIETMRGAYATAQQNVLLSRYRGHENDNVVEMHVNGHTKMVKPSQVAGFIKDLHARITE